MKSKLKWLDRTLSYSPIYYALCLSEEEFHGELRRLGIKERPDFLSSSHANATVHHLSGEDGKSVALVCLGSTMGFSREEVYGLLLHEAVHIWQEVCRLIGERNPGDEQEAYAIQSLSQSLMVAYRDRRK